MKFKFEPEYPIILEGKNELEAKVKFRMWLENLLLPENINQFYDVFKIIEVKL